MRETLAELEQEKADDSALLIWLAQINRGFNLSESLRETLKRPWYDLLQMRLAIDAEARVVDRMRAENG